MLATSHFSDVPAEHPNRVDIETVAGWGGYSGYEDGTSNPTGESARSRWQPSSAGYSRTG